MGSLGVALLMGICHVIWFCTCRMLESSKIIQCSEYAEWFHIRCGNLPEIAIEDSSVLWHCSSCS